MKKSFFHYPCLTGLLCLNLLNACQTTPAELVLINAEIYTMEENMPWARSLAINGNTITGVFESDETAQKYIGPDTRVVDLDGRFVLPGFIDAHVHFNRAGALINDANLMSVADEAGLQKEMHRVAGLLGEGEWITGGLWGAYEQWSYGASGADEKAAQRWEPDRWMIDGITATHPCLLNNFDYSMYLANTLALEMAGIRTSILEGMRTNAEGVATGLIFQGSPALEQIRAVIAEKSHERLLNENRAALKKLRECGIVEIHDIARPEQTRRFVELENQGELTCRVWLRPDLSRASQLKNEGYRPGMHPQKREENHWLRLGALKGYIDGIMGTHGALFFEPYDDQPGNYGHYRQHTSDDPALKEGNMEKMYGLIQTGYEAGFVTNVHAIGTKGVALMLDTFERLKRELEIDLTGFRVIHAQVIRPEDFSRFRELNVIAEVNPYHLSDDMRWMEERIGYERCKGAYAFQSLIQNGAMLSFGSDWPGTSAAEYQVHPKYLIHAAVNRTTIKGIPEGGWFPEQKITMHEALKAYTINNAIAAFEGHLRGSIKTGKLADITVCDRNLMKIDPEEVLQMAVVMTIVDGRVVFEDL